MQVFVRDFNGKTATLNVEPSDSVGQIKQMYENLEGISSSSQRLIFAGKQLEDNNEIQAYGIKSDDTLHLTSFMLGGGESGSGGSSTGTKHIYIRTLNGKNISIDVNDTDTIKSLKDKITDIEGVSADQQRLVFNGKQMEDGNTIQDYGIQEDSSIHLVLRLRGGF